MGNSICSMEKIQTLGIESFVSGDLKVGKFRHLINLMMLSSVSIQGQCNFLNFIKDHSHVQYI